jgi:hypothetical protein
LARTEEGYFLFKRSLREVRMKTKRIVIFIILILFSISIPRSQPADAQHLDVFPTKAGNVGYLGQIGGANLAVAIQGNYAFVGAGPRMLILDLSDPLVPVRVGETPPMPDEVKDIEVAGGYAYALDAGSAMHIVSIANPATPDLMGEYQAPMYTNHLAIAGNYAYMASWEGGLRIVDISDPTAPAEVGYLDTFYAQDVAYAEDVAVTGKYAYVVVNGGLHIVNITNPRLPFEVGGPVSQGRLVVVAGNYAYLAGGGLRIVDISNPAAPHEVGYFDKPYSVLGLMVAGRYAYLVDYASGLHIVNITYPNAPYETGNYFVSFPNDVAVAGGYAYVASETGLRVINVAKPTAPFEASRYNITISNAVTVVNDYAYLTNGYGLQIVNVAKPASLFEEGYYDTPGNATGVSVAGNYAYIADGYWGLRIVNISDPAAPLEVSDSNISASDVVVVGKYAYVAYAVDIKGIVEGWISIVDVANPAAPFVVYIISNGYRLAVAGDYAYIADDWGLRIVDISDPAAPVEVSTYTIAISGDFAVAGDYAYVSNAAGLVIIDVSNPNEPVGVGQLETPISHVAVSGDYAYLAGLSGGLKVVNVSDPAAPYEVGYYPIPGYAYAVAVDGNNIYVSYRDLGLYILRYIGDGDFDTKIALPLSMK